MNVNDYLIDQAGIDWQRLLTGWAEILPETFTIWLVNRFGDVFIIAEDGSVNRLDVVGGRLDRLADTRDQFADLMDVPQNANSWLMIPLVDQCVNAGLSLQDRQCYGFKVPPLLGGEYEPSNIAPVDLAENYAFLADIWTQTRDLPNGTPLRLIIGPDPTRNGRALGDLTTDLGDNGIRTRLSYIEGRRRGATTRDDPISGYPQVNPNRPVPS